MFALVRRREWSVVCVKRTVAGMLLTMRLIWCGCHDQAWRNTQIMWSQGPMTWESAEKSAVRSSSSIACVEKWWHRELVWLCSDDVTTRKLVSAAGVWGHAWMGRLQGLGAASIAVSCLCRVLAWLGGDAMSAVVMGCVFYSGLVDRWSQTCRQLGLGGAITHGVEGGWSVCSGWALPLGCRWNRSRAAVLQLTVADAELTHNGIDRGRSPRNDLTS